MSHPMEEDPLRDSRKILVDKIRPLILRAIGITEEEVTQAPIIATFPQEKATELQCIAFKMGTILVGSVKTFSAPANVIPGVTFSYVTTHEFSGEADASKIVKYQAIDDEGNELNEEDLNAIFGEPMGPMEHPSDPLGVFDDETYLVQTLSRLDPASGIRVD